ncbi:rCG43065 [Rattus norvegicus]|uniref:RCG43065 n=1 Tax=Rattus norvegicus TaxID=10116 RepID=A6IW47_RAT|nr:rCG43065 [Rattus norvegicus]
MSFLPNGLGSLLTPQRTSAFYNFSNFSSQASCWSCPTGRKGDSRWCDSGSGSTCQSHCGEGHQACLREPEGTLLT